MTTVARSRSRRRFLLPVWVRVSLISTVLLWSFGLTAYLAGRVEDWSGSSDHGPFLDAGVRALYYGVEDHDSYHRPSDTADRIPQPFFAEAASLVIDTVRAIDEQR